MSVCGNLDKQTRLAKCCQLELRIGTGQGSLLCLLWHMFKHFHDKEILKDVKALFMLEVLISLDQFVSNICY